MDQQDLLRNPQPPKEKLDQRDGKHSIAGQCQKCLSASKDACTL